MGESVEIGVVGCDVGVRVAAVFVEYVGCHEIVRKRT
jgi:hypothetical protein